MRPSQPPSTQRSFITVTEDDDLDLDALLIDDSFSTSQENPPPPVASFSPRSAVPISAIEEDTADGHWVLPTPAQPGDFLTSSIHRVPSKSILKKTSSYGNFDLTEPISSSKRATSISNMKKKPSYLSFSDHMNTSMNSGVGSAGSSGNFGLDLDSSSQSQMSTSYTLGMANHRNSMPNFHVVDVAKPDTPPLAADKASNSGADAAAGTLETSLGSSSKALSASGSKMRRNVSFHAVDVRQYDRTVGDNVSCCQPGKHASSITCLTQLSHLISLMHIIYISHRAARVPPFPSTGPTPKQPPKNSTSTNSSVPRNASLT